MRWLWLGAVLLAGCGDPQETTSDGGTGGQGGAGGSPTTTTTQVPCTPPPPTGTCSDPLLSYEPKGATAFEPITGAPLIARLDAFKSSTTCKTLILGLVTDANCAPPQNFTVSTWSSAAAEPSDSTQNAIALHADTAQGTPLGNGASEYRFALEQHYAACEFPYVMIWGQPGVCPVGVHPACDPSKAWRRDDMGWKTLSDSTGNDAQLYIGVADCEGT